MKYLPALLIVALCGCGSLIKSEYPTTNYYRLTQVEGTFRPADSLPGTLLVRSFAVNTEYYSDNIQTTDNNIQIKPYFYHRWTGLPDELITDFFVNRFSEYALFHSVVHSSSMAMPQYILEGKVLEFIGRNDERGQSTADVKIQVSLLHTGNTKNPVLLQKIYERRAPRRDGSQHAIAEAMSRAMSELTDAVAADIYNLLGGRRSNAGAAQIGR